MLIAIAAQGGSMDSPVEERFGRAAGFIICDTEKSGLRWHDNSQNLQSAQGAGIQSAKHVIESDATVLIARNVGPKAYDLLERAGVAMYLCPEECRLAGEAIDKFKAGMLQRLSGANQEGHW